MAGQRPRGNGIERDVGTKDRVAHDPQELEAVAMRAIGHMHGQDELDYQHSSSNPHHEIKTNAVEHYQNPYEEYIDPHHDPMLYYTSD